jgi:hypothetical protein
MVVLRRANSIELADLLLTGSWITRRWRRRRSWWRRSNWADGTGSGTTGDGEAADSGDGVLDCATSGLEEGDTTGSDDKAITEVLLDRSADELEICKTDDDTAGAGPDQVPSQILIQMVEL